MANPNPLSVLALKNPHLGRGLISLSFQMGRGTYRWNGFNHLEDTLNFLKFIAINLKIPDIIQVKSEGNFVCARRFSIRLFVL